MQKQDSPYECGGLGAQVKMHMEIGIPIIIVALIVVIVGYAIFWFSALRLGKRAIDRLPGPAKQAQAPNVDTKACPQCAETIKQAAKICHYCRYEFPA